MSRPQPRDRFDPAQPGVCDRVWQRALEELPFWAPSTRHVLVVSPHPDDEVLGVGGFMRECEIRGTRVTVVSVTDGESAYAGVADLATVRQDELRTALQLLAPATAIHRLGIPDGKVAQFAASLDQSLRRYVDEETTVVVPYEFDGHPDHEAVGRVGMSLGVPVVRYPIWFWHRAIPADLSPLRMAKVALSPQSARVKRQAVRCFRSQTAPVGHAPILPSHVLAYFHRPYEIVVH